MLNNGHHIIGGQKPSLNPLTDEDRKHINESLPDSALNPKRVPEFDIRIAGSLTPQAKAHILNDPESRSAHEATLMQQAQTAIGKGIVDVITTNPHRRLFPMLFLVKTVSHDVDIVAAFWELRAPEKEST